jgi:hypothetical protein
VESTARPRTGRGAVVGWSVEGERRRSGDGAGRWRGGASGFKDKEKGGREERTVTGRDTEIGGVVVSRRGRPAEKWTGPGLGRLY